MRLLIPLKENHPRRVLKKQVGVNWEKYANNFLWWGVVEFIENCTKFKISISFLLLPSRIEAEST